MARSSNTVYAQHLNAAFALLAQGRSRADAAREMMQSQGLSRQQAYRYLAAAQKLSAPVAVPDSKATLTVRISKRLLQAVRQWVRDDGCTLSDFVGRALEGEISRHGEGRD